MDPINAHIFISPAPSAPSTSHSAAAVLPRPSAPTSADGTDPVQFDASLAQQKQVEAVIQKSQDIADTHVLGDQDFTLFKDHSGQLITRFRNRETGKITYVPQPELFKMTGSSTSDAPAMLKIKA